MHSRNPLTTLLEASRTEASLADNLYDDDIEATFESCYKELPEVDQPFYSEEAVPVFGGADGAVIVEADNLARYMESNNITDVAQALSNLAEHYNQDPRNMVVMVESEDEAREVVEEAKSLAQKMADRSKLVKVKSSTDFLRDLKVKGIRVAKKKSKKKGKKK